MKVSVVIPAYNEEKYIGNCLESLKNQELKPEEIIVVDNNCTDNTIPIAKKYQVKIIKEQKQGMISARNTGFNHAKYDIIARIDADTVLFPDWIKKIKQIFSKDKIGAIAGPIYFRDLTFSRFFSKIHALIYFPLLKLVHGHYPLFGSNMAIKKSVWEKVRDELCVDEKNIHEDVDMAIHLAQYSSIEFVPDLYATIRLRNITKYIEYPWRWLKMINRHCRFRLVKRK